MDKELDEKIATELFGWERLDVTYWGEEGKRQAELEDWLDRLEITEIGEYFIDVGLEFYIKVSEWHPTEDGHQALSILLWLDINDLHWTLNNVLPGSDPPVYELRISKKNIYVCNYTVPLTICDAAEKLIRINNTV